MGDRFSALQLSINGKTKTVFVPKDFGDDLNPVNIQCFTKSGKSVMINLVDMQGPHPVRRGTEQDGGNVPSTSVAGNTSNYRTHSVRRGTEQDGGNVPSTSVTGNTSNYRRLQSLLKKRFPSNTTTVSSARGRSQNHQLQQQQQQPFSRAPFVPSHVPPQMQSNYNMTANQFEHPGPVNAPYLSNHMPPAYHSGPNPPRMDLRLQGSFNPAFAPNQSLPQMQPNYHSGMTVPRSNPMMNAYPQRPMNPQQVPPYMQTNYNQRQSVPVNPVFAPDHVPPREQPNYNSRWTQGRTFHMQQYGPMDLSCTSAAHSQGNVNPALRSDQFSIGSGQTTNPSSLPKSANSGSDDSDACVIIESDESDIEVLSEVLVINDDDEDCTKDSVDSEESSRTQPDDNGSESTGKEFVYHLMGISMKVKTVPGNNQAETFDMECVNIDEGGFLSSDDDDDDDGNDTDGETNHVTLSSTVSKVGPAPDCNEDEFQVTINPEFDNSTASGNTNTITVKEEDCPSETMDNHLETSTISHVDDGNSRTLPGDEDDDEHQSKVQKWNFDTEMEEEPLSDVHPQQLFSATRVKEEPIPASLPNSSVGSDTSVSVPVASDTSHSVLAPPSISNVVGDSGVSMPIASVFNAQDSDLSKLIAPIDNSVVRGSNILSIPVDSSISKHVQDTSVSIPIVPMNNSILDDNTISKPVPPMIRSDEQDTCVSIPMAPINNSVQDINLYSPIIPVNNNVLHETNLSMSEPLSNSRVAEDTSITDPIEHEMDHGLVDDTTSELLPTPSNSSNVQDNGAMSDMGDPHNSSMTSYGGEFSSPIFKPCYVSIERVDIIDMFGDYLKKIIKKKSDVESKEVENDESHKMKASPRRTIRSNHGNSGPLSKRKATVDLDSEPAKRQKIMLPNTAEKSLPSKNLSPGSSKISPTNIGSARVVIEQLAMGNSINSAPPNRPSSQNSESHQKHLAPKSKPSQVSKCELALSVKKSLPHPKSKLRSSDSERRDQITLNQPSVKGKKSLRFKAYSKIREKVHIAISNLNNSMNKNVGQQKKLVTKQQSQESTSEVQSVRAERPQKLKTKKVTGIDSGFMNSKSLRSGPVNIAEKARSSQKMQGKGRGRGKGHHKGKGEGHTKVAHTSTVSQEKLTVNRNRGRGRGRGHFSKTIQASLSNEKSVSETKRRSSQKDSVDESASGNENQQTLHKKGTSFRGKVQSRGRGRHMKSSRDDLTKPKSVADDDNTRKGHNRSKSEESIIASSEKDTNDKSTNEEQGLPASHKKVTSFRGRGRGNWRGRGRGKAVVNRVSSDPHDTTVSGSLSTPMCNANEDNSKSEESIIASSEKDTNDKSTNEEQGLPASHKKVTSFRGRGRGNWRGRGRGSGRGKAVVNRVSSDPHDRTVSGSLSTPVCNANKDNSNLNGDDSSTSSVKIEIDVDESNSQTGLPVITNVVGQQSAEMGTGLTYQPGPILVQTMNGPMMYMPGSQISHQFPASVDASSYNAVIQNDKTSNSLPEQNKIQNPIGFCNSFSAQQNMYASVFPVNEKLVDNNDQKVLVSAPVASALHPQFTYQPMLYNQAATQAGYQQQQSMPGPMIPIQQMLSFPQMMNRGQMLYMQGSYMPQLTRDAIDCNTGSHNVKDTTSVPDQNRMPNNNLTLSLGSQPSFAKLLQSTPTKAPMLSENTPNNIFVYPHMPPVQNNIVLLNYDQQSQQAGMPMQNIAGDSLICTNQLATENNQSTNMLSPVPRPPNDSRAPAICGQNSIASDVGPQAQESVAKVKQQILSGTEAQGSQSKFKLSKQKFKVARGLLSTVGSKKS